MLLSSLLIIPIIGIFLILTDISYADTGKGSIDLSSKYKSQKIIAFITSIVNLVVSLVIFILFDFSSNQFQFVQEHYDVNSLFDIYLGIDGISMYFVLLTTIIMPIAILSN
jgi:NADH:ubiquinone oxidoreductase subunit 4 (subunit M)